MRLGIAALLVGLLAPSARAECEFTIHEAGLTPLANGSLLIAPQNYGPLAGRPQHATEQVLDPTGKVAKADGVPRTERDHKLWSSTDHMSICRGLEAKQLSCTEFDLPEDLAKLDGHAASATDPKGRYLVLSFHDKQDRLFFVSFAADGKRLATWRPVKSCPRETPSAIVGRTVIDHCPGESSDIGTQLIVRDVRTGKQLGRIEGAFDGSIAVIDETHFVVYRHEPRALEAYDLAKPRAPVRAWRTPTTMVKPSIVHGASAVVAIDKTSPWSATMLDPATGKNRVDFRLTVCP